MGMPLRVAHELDGRVETVIDQQPHQTPPEVSVTRRWDPLSDCLQILPVREVLRGVVVSRIPNPVPDAAVNRGVAGNDPYVLASESPEPRV